MDKPRVKPLEWEYHPAGAKAEPPTGHAYIIDTRMEGRVYTIKGLNPQREFASTDDAKAAAQVDYEARILAALEPVTVQEAARVLLDMPKDDRTKVWQVTRGCPTSAEFGEWFYKGLTALAQEDT